MNRLLVIGAGASLEECKRSGNYPVDKNRYLPLISNFCTKLFNPTSTVLQQSTAIYLTSLGKKYDSKLLNLKAGDSFTGEDINRSPVGVFLQLEKESSETYNIEKLCEFLWQKFNTNISFWDDFIYEGIYLNLFALFTEQFGLGKGRSMQAGSKIANLLIPGDAVLNLNYDIVFDLALKQAKQSICYAPANNQQSINVYKPHGSINLYINPVNGNFFFEEPDKIKGSVGISDPSGGYFYPHCGIVPPRLNKNYQQHPVASYILQTGRPIHPKIITFWGLSLTESDTDLLQIYKEAFEGSESVEFINPDAEAYNRAVKLLGDRITHYRTLDEWFFDNKIVL